MLLAHSGEVPQQTLSSYSNELHVEIQAFVIRVCKRRILPSPPQFARPADLLMGGTCGQGEHWDALLRKCLQCRLVCQQPHVNIRCLRYCESSMCKALPGHYYDLLLKKCMRCADICGRHPAECAQHCRASPPPVTTKLLMDEVTHMQTSRGLIVATALEDSNILIYSLLALCIVLVVSSLSIALAVFPRRSKDTSSSPGPKKANPKQQCVVELGKEIGPRSNASVTNSSHPTDCKPSEDPYPTETCVCVHCFPDLKALGHANDRPVRAPFTFYQQAVLHEAQTQKGCPLQTEDSLYSSGIEVHEEAAVG